MAATLRKEFEEQLDYISYLGSRIFLCPFIGRSKLTIKCHSFVCFLLFFTSMQLFLTPCLYGVNDWMDIINIAPNIGACLISLIKYSKTNANKEVYEETFRHFRDDLWEFFPHNLSEYKQILARYKNISIALTRFLFALTITLIIVVDSLPYIIMKYENKVLGKDLKYLYPFNAWYPFDKVKWYSVAYLWESIMTAIVICIFAFTNVVHMCFIAYICMELKLLGNYLGGLISREDVEHITKRKRVKEIHNKIKINLKSIIKKHDFLARKALEFDRILGDVMLLSYTSGAVFICLTAFSFTVVDDLYTSLRYFSFFVSLLVDCFSQCIIGQVLIDHSTELTGMIYSSEWTYADAETRKILLMLMTRTLKPFKLTANSYLIMNLNTFSRICSSSYNCFNLLRTVYNPKYK